MIIYLSDFFLKISDTVNSHFSLFSNIIWAHYFFKSEVEQLFNLVLCFYILVKCK